MRTKRLLVCAMVAATVVSYGNVSAFAQPESQLNETRSKISQVGEKIRSAQETIAETNVKLETIQGEIAENKKNISSLTDEITGNEASIKELKSKLSAQEQIYGDRLRYNYKYGMVSTIKTLIGAGDFSDFMLKVKVIKSILNEDQKLIGEIRTMNRDLEDKNRVLTANREKLETAGKALIASEEQLGKTKDSQVAELSNLNNEKDNLYQLLQGQEVAMFDEIRSILMNQSSSEDDIKNALAVLNAIRNQVTTAAGESEVSKYDSELSARLAKFQAQAEEAAKIESAFMKAEEQKIASGNVPSGTVVVTPSKPSTSPSTTAAPETSAPETSAPETKAPVTTTPSTTAAPETSAPETKAPATTAPAQETKTFYLSFYSSLPSMNGGYTGTASGAPLEYGVVASNVYPFYTRIYLEGWGIMTVLDRGGSHFDSSDRLDIFIPRKAGESDSAYISRLMALGRQTAQGYIIK